MKPTDFKVLSTYLLYREARKMGVQVTKIFPETKLSYLKLRSGNKVSIIIGQRIANLSFNAHFVCKDKEMTRRFLRESGISVVEGNYFTRKKISEALTFIKKLDFPVVIKPVDETWGRGVFLDVRDLKTAKEAITKVLKSRSRFLVEKQFFGQEFRILSTRKKILGVINRIPANVEGDGRKTIEELIEIKNRDPRRGQGHEKSLVKIKIDKEVIDNLRTKGINLKYIPPKGEIIFLRKNSNISTGGDSIDVTDKIHPKIKKLAPKIISAIPGLPYAGFDFMTPDIAKDPEKVGYAVIEINDSPMLSMHHIPYRGKKRNVSGEILKLVFS